MHRFPFIYLIAVVLVLPCLRVQAQNDSTAVKQKKERKVELFGSVYDSFTKVPLKAHVTLMQASDSSVVDTTTCYIWDRESYYELKTPARPGSYIIKGTCEGYDDAFLDYPLRYLARNNRFELPMLLMKKKANDIWREDSLGGVVITGTRVKFAYRGDTLVYNASAFNLPEGSMLDGLIRQMPGAELKDNGDIYINGRKVDYLTLNGKDFFKGQNKTMLDNLPYFTVRELKVYDKSTKQSELMGHDVEKKDYVMDVLLKRQYNRGLMGNAEVGHGTEGRYMGRLFGLYYDDNTRVALFGNANNVNETRHPGSDGEWSPAEMPVGLRSTKMAGINLNTQDANKRWEETFSASVTWSDAETATRTATETFATAGNTFGGSAAASRQKDFRMHAENYFQIQKPITVWNSVRMDYSNGDHRSSSADSTYSAALINRTLNNGLDSYRTLSLNANVGLHKKFEWGDYVTLYFNAGYTRQRPSESFNTNDTYYAWNDSKDYRHYYNDGPQERYNYEARLQYTFQMPGRWFIAPYAGYTQRMNSIHDMSYRLDWLYPEYGFQSPATASGQSPAGKKTPALTWLPSTREALAPTLDQENSCEELHHYRTYASGLELHHTTDDGFFSVELPVEVNRERMSYWEEDFDTLCHRSYTTFQPTVSFYRWNVRRGLQHATYSMSRNHPSLSSLMPDYDSTDPLALRLNNPDLKPSTTHSASIAFAFSNDSTRRFIRVWTDASIVQNAWGTRTAYEETTGAYTYLPDNINGNWTCSVGVSYQRPLDSKKRLTLSQQTNANYDHSVDFDILRETPAYLPDLDKKSTVHNLTLSEALKLEYQKGKLTATLSGHLDYRMARSRRENFQGINAFDFDYGFTLNYSIPFVKVDVATDMRMFSRRGYYSAMMNDNHLVWNAQLSRTFLKGRMTARLQAFDLLHQLSNTQYTVNAQGRTETWQQCIPRYVMLSLAYKLTQKPKR